MAVRRLPRGNDHLRAFLKHTGGWYLQIDAKPKFNFNTRPEYDLSFEVRYRCSCGGQSRLPYTCRTGAHSTLPSR